MPKKNEKEKDFSGLQHPAQILLPLLTINKGRFFRQIQKRRTKTFFICPKKYVHLSA